MSEHVIYAAAERDFQVAIQAALDISSIILAEQSVNVPEAYRDLFPALAEIGVLPVDLGRRLSYMAQFRNVLVHLYLQVDPRKVYDYLQNNVGDLELYSKYVGDYLAGRGADVSA
ncbi:MAG: DUF86 domain-containing protein [Anaerolineae bacterium]